MITMEMIKNFVDLSKSLNITKTAEKNSLTKSAVSKQIKNLEEELKTTLIVSNNKGINFTEAGYAFLPYAVKMIEALEEGKSMLLNREFVVGALGLSAIPIHSIMTEVQNKMDFTIKTVSVSGMLSNELLNHKIDAFLYTQKLESGLEIKQKLVGRDNACLIVNQKSSFATLDEINSLDIKNMKIWFFQYLDENTEVLANKNTMVQFPLNTNYVMSNMSDSDAFLIPSYKLSYCLSFGKAIRISNIITDMYICYLNDNPKIDALCCALAKHFSIGK